MAFNELFNKQSGAGRAEGYSARDVMLAFGTGYDDPKPDENFQQGLATSFPMLEEEQPDTFLQDLADRRDNSTSLMETMNPGKDYKPPEIKDDLKRDATKVVTDGESVSKKVSGGMEAVQSQKAEFKADFMQAKSEVAEMLKDVAKDMDLDPNDVTDQMMAKGDASSMGMLAGAGASVAMGPVGAVAAGGHGVIGELSKKDKQLPAKEQEAILKEVLTRLKESRAAPDSREEASARGKIDGEVATDSPKQSEFAWEEMEIEDLAALMTADPEGKDQPEWEALLEVENKLKEAQVNHAGVVANYAGSGDLEAKALQSAKSGNEATASLISEAQVLRVDAGTMGLAGDDVKGIVSGVTVADASGIDTSGVAKDLNLDLMNEAAIKEQLDGDIKAQFSV